VKSDEWRLELARSAPMIRARLDLVLGPGVVAWIDVANGPSER
jgi:hypothetical protein